LGAIIDLPDDSSYFIPSTCANVTFIGLICNISNQPCAIRKSCVNDDHVCTPNPCWNSSLISFFIYNLRTMFCIKFYQNHLCLLLFLLLRWIY